MDRNKLLPFVDGTFKLNCENPVAIAENRQVNASVPSVDMTLSPASVRLWSWLLPRLSDSVNTPAPPQAPPEVLDLSGHGFGYDPATQRVGPFGAHIRGKVWASVPDGSTVVAHVYAPDPVRKVILITGPVLFRNLTDHHFTVDCVDGQWMTVANGYFTEGHGSIDTDPGLPAGHAGAVPSHPEYRIHLTGATDRGAPIGVDENVVIPLRRDCCIQVQARTMTAQPASRDEVKPLIFREVLLVSPLRVRNATPAQIVITVAGQMKTIGRRKECHVYSPQACGSQRGVLPEGGGFRDKNLTLQVALKIDETSNDQTAMSTPVFLKEPDQHQSSSIVLSCSIPQDQRHGKINLQLVWDSTQRIVTVFAPIWFVDASGLNVRASSKGKVLPVYGDGVSFLSADDETIRFTTASGDPVNMMLPALGTTEVATINTHARPGPERGRAPNSALECPVALRMERVRADETFDVPCSVITLLPWILLHNRTNVKVWYRQSGCKGPLGSATSGSLIFIQDGSHG
jgi:hypothetical protein